MSWDQNITQFLFSLTTCAFSAQRILRGNLYAHRQFFYKMDRFRRNSKSSLKSVKSLDSSTESSAPSQQPQSKLWPQHEVELFKQIQSYLKEGENVSGTGKTGNVLSMKAKFGSEVDLADEAYKTLRKPSDKNSKIPRLAQPSDGKSSEPEESKPEPVGSPTEEPEGGQSKDEQPLDAGQEENYGGNADQKKEEDIDEHTPILVNIIINCTAFTIAVILVTYFFFKDLVPAKFPNFRQRWEYFTATFIISPAFVNKLYEEVFEPMTIRTKLPAIFKNPFAKPAAI